MLKSPGREDGCELSTEVDWEGKKIQVSQTFEPRGPGVRQSQMARLRNCRPCYAREACLHSAGPSLEVCSEACYWMWCCHDLSRDTHVFKAIVSERRHMWRAGDSSETIWELHVPGDAVSPEEWRYEPPVSQTISVNNASTGCESCSFTRVFLTLRLSNTADLPLPGTM